MDTMMYRPEIWTQKEAEASEERYRALTELSLDGVFVVYRDEIVCANDAMRRLFGLDVRELSRPALSLVHGEDRGAVEAAAATLMTLGGVGPEIQHRFLRADGTVAQVVARAARIPWCDGYALQIVLRDVSKSSELELANEALRGFTHHVAHDLRAPLRSVASSSRILIEDYGDQLPVDAVRLLRRQADSARRLADLVDDLLQYARLARSEPRRERVDVTVLAREAATDVLELYPDSTAQVSVVDDLWAVADPKLVRLVLLNLIENAVKYSPNGGEIWVGQSEPGVLWVRDHGVGFDALQAERIFERFERLRHDEFAGSGIGLANVRKAVSLHGGRVWAQSAPGEGASFFFTLN